LVSLRLTVNPEDENLFASIKVIDTSALLRAPDIPQPSLETMVKLEQEINLDQIGDFVDGDDYMQDTAKREQLLATQGWRAGLLDDYFNFN
jgi:hypothetical protein